MRISRLTLTSAVAAMAMMLVGACAQAAGFQQGVAADPDGKPLTIGVWSPSQTVPTSISMGRTTMSVATGAPVNGTALPMIVMSHGAGGSYLGHFDTAIALADAGFVLVAMNHTGDNYADQSRSTDIMDRPRQVSREYGRESVGLAGERCPASRRASSVFREPGRPNDESAQPLGYAETPRLCRPACKALPDVFAKNLEFDHEGAHAILALATAMAWMAGH